jgi:16S rRNA (cytosine1402-N4)-methyltransferase
MEMHIPVLLEEMLKYLQPKEGKTYLDCTFGTGGYSKAILKETACSVIAIDQDPHALLYANQLKTIYGDRFRFYLSNFANLKRLPIEKIDGVVFDIGTSSIQLKNPERGFSFQQNGLLDMRMDPSDPSILTAKELIDSLNEEELANIIYNYGGEKHSRKIAKAIFLKKSEITTTFELAQVIRETVKTKRYGKIDAATKTFQSLRIAVNNELENFAIALEQVTTLLNQGGNAVVVTFHSLEDKIAKTFFKKFSQPKISKSKYALQVVEKNKDFCNNEHCYEILTKKPIVSKKEEIEANPSARSAKLRAAIKISAEQ